jgi:tetratricopeptide (TPR) repeat protein
MLEKVDNLLQLDPQQCEPHIVELEQIADNNKNKTLSTVIEIYRGTINYYTGQNDSAAVNFENATKMASEIGNQRLRSTAAIRKLFVIDRNADPDIMLGMMSEEHELAKSNKDTINMIYSLNGMAMYNERLDSTKHSIDLYVKATQLAKENNNKFEYGFLLNNLALLKLRMHSNDDALDDLNEGIALAKELNNIRLELTLRENLGYYYSAIDSIELAEKEYNNTLQLANERNYAQLAFNSLVNLGVVARRKGEVDKSDSLLQLALDRAKKTRLYYAVPAIYLTRAQIELGRENYDHMNRMLDSAKVYGKYVSMNEIQEAFYNLKYQEYKKRKDFEAALEYYQKYRSFKDSLDNAGHLQIMEELQLKYDVEKEEKKRLEEKNIYEKKIDQQELSNANLRQKIGAFIVLIIIIVAGFIIYYFRT